MILSFDDVKARNQQRIFRRNKYKNIQSSFKNQSFETGNNLDISNKKYMNNSLYDLRIVLHDYIPIVLDTLFDLILDPNSDPKDVIRCVEIVLNRYAGKPKEHVEISSQNVMDVPATVALSSIESRFKLMPPGPEKEELKMALEKSKKVFKNDRK